MCVLRKCIISLIFVMRVRVIIARGNCNRLSGVETAGSGGSMNRGHELLRAPSLEINI